MRLLASPRRLGDGDWTPDAPTLFPLDFPMHRALLALAIPACAVFAGCDSTFHDARFNDGEGASGERTLIVPFRQSRREIWYRESPEGRAIVKFLRLWTEKQGIDTLFAESEDEADVLHRVGNWPNDRIRKDDWVRLARPAGVRYVVEGDILSLQLENKLSIGFFDPRAVIKFRVIDVLSGREVLHREAWKLAFTDRESQLQLSSKFESSQQVMALFLAYIGKRLGQELYGYYDE